MSIINSPHSFERLNWSSEDIFKPIIKTEIMKPKDSYIELIIPKRVCVDKDNKLDDIDESGVKHNLGHATPPCHNQPGEKPPKSVIKYYNEMQEWIKGREENIVFMTLTLPPQTPITVNRKKIEYASAKVKDQIRFMRSKIQHFLYGKCITDYIIVFEIFKKSPTIHAHFIYNDKDDQYGEDYKDLCDLCGIFKYKQQQIATCEHLNVSPTIIEYLCKITMNDSE